MGRSAKLGVALTKAGAGEPATKSWVTWPISSGGRHRFSGLLCEVGPKDRLQVWIRNFTAEKPTEQFTWKRYGQPYGKDKSEEGKIFNGCGKEWLVGKTDLDWTQTQAWIKGLGNGWRAPTRFELEALYRELGQNSPVGQDFVWAEPRDAHSAWHFSFYYRETRWGYFDDHSRYGRAVAVRP